MTVATPLRPTRLALANGGNGAGRAVPNAKLSDREGSIAAVGGRPLNVGSSDTATLPLTVRLLAMWSGKTTRSTECEPSEDLGIDERHNRVVLRLCSSRVRGRRH